MAVEAVLAPGRPVAADDEWRLVTATGIYLPEETVIVRYRTHKSTSGVEVVVPLELPDGTAVLVDRGWTMTENVGTVSADEVPPPPEGEVQRGRLGPGRCHRRQHRGHRPVDPGDLERGDRGGVGP